MQLRPYQVASVDAVFRELASVRATLLVLPTGCGKTICFAEVARRFRPHGRVLVLAHREELVRQAVDKIERTARLVVGIEMADHRSDGGLFGCDVVVATVQSISRRLERYAPDAFGLIVIDEAHHAPSGSSYRSVLDHFAGAKVLGVTATPDRSDRLAMGTVFESVALSYEIRDAIDEGFLAPIRQKAVHVEGLDLSRVRTTAGDLNEGDLEEILVEEENLHGIAFPTVEMAGDRPTLVFAASVAHAHALATVIGRHSGREAVALDGTVDRGLRSKTLSRFQGGEFQFLVNCALFLEGFDAPRISCVAMARPTKSRALYAQAIGRGTRLHPGKADLLVLDFEGNAGRHSLVSAVDILGGKDEEEVLAAARALAAGGERSVTEAIDEARARIADERRRKVVARARYSAVNIDPFQILGAVEERKWWSDDAPTEAQLASLEAAGIGTQGMTKGKASALIGQMKDRRARGLCTFKQARMLARNGRDPDVSFDEAHRQIDLIAAEKGWKGREAR